MAQGAWPKGHGRLAQHRIALEDGDGTTGLEKVRLLFRVCPTTSMFYRSVKWTSAYAIRSKPVAFSMASIKVSPENGFVR